MTDQPKEISKPYKFEFGHGVCDAHFVENCPACAGGATKTQDLGGGFTLDAKGNLVPLPQPETVVDDGKVPYKPVDCGSQTDPVYQDPVVVAAKNFAESKMDVARITAQLEDFRGSVRICEKQLEHAKAAVREAKGALDDALNPPEPGKSRSGNISLAEGE